MIIWLRVNLLQTVCILDNNIYHNSKRFGWNEHVWVFTVCKWPPFMGSVNKSVCLEVYVKWRRCGRHMKQSVVCTWEGCAVCYRLTRPVNWRDDYCITKIFQEIKHSIKYFQVTWYVFSYMFIYNVWKRFSTKKTV